MGTALFDNKKSLGFEDCRLERVMSYFKPHPIRCYVLYAINRQNKAKVVDNSQQKKGEGNVAALYTEREEIEEREKR